MSCGQLLGSSCGAICRQATAAGLPRVRVRADGNGPRRRRNVAGRTECQVAGGGNRHPSARTLKERIAAKLVPAEFNGKGRRASGQFRHADATRQLRVIATELQRCGRVLLTLRMQNPIRNKEWCRGKSSPLCNRFSRYSARCCVPRIRRCCRHRDGGRAHLVLGRNRAVDRHACRELHPTSLDKTTIDRSLAPTISVGSRCDWYAWLDSGRGLVVGTWSSQSGSSPPSQPSWKGGRWLCADVLQAPTLLFGPKPVRAAMQLPPASGVVLRSIAVGPSYRRRGPD